MHHCVRYIGAILLICTGSLAMGQEVPRILSFDKNEYKAYNQNWGISQSPQGLMYFANSAGLLEFDGRYWQTYPLPDKQTLRTVACDQGGRIYGGGYGEFGYWEPNELGVLQYHSLRAELDYPPAEAEEIWNIVLDSQLVLFQSFSDVYIYDYEKVYRVDDPGLLLFIKKIGADWIIPVIQQGLYTWTPTAGFRFLEASATLQQMRVKGLVPDTANDFWIATERNGLFILREGEGITAWPTAVDSQLQDYQINRMIRLRSGHLAIGTILDGVFILDQQGQLVYHLNKESGLQNNTVLGLWEDHNGNLWLALDKGINLLLLSQALNFYPDVSGKLGTVYTAKLFQGQLYIGTNQGLYTKNFGQAEEFTLIEGTQGQVWDLFEHDGQLWCGHNNGTFLVSGHQIQWISSVTGGWCMQALPKHNNVLVQSTYTGFAVFRKRGESWQFENRLAGLQAPIKQFFFDEDGYIWALHGTRGLWRVKFDEQQDSITDLQSLTEADGLPTTFGLGLIRMGNELLVRSDMSYFRWSPTAQKLLPLEVFRGQVLPDERISLLPGLQDEWFMATADNRIKWFRAEQQLADWPLQLVPNFEQIIPIDSATYLFCLDNGYALLHTPDQDIQQDQIPDPLISKIEVLRPQRRAIFPFRSTIQADQALEFSPQERQIRFSYAQPYYGEQIQYRHRLLNYDDQWSDWSQLAFTEFSSLKAGFYIFELEADHGRGVARQAFRVLPHWYETIWARITYVLLSILVGLIVWKGHQARLRKHLKRLEREKEKQLQEERIRTRNEKLQEDVLRKSQELANSTFNLVRKNEILMQLKEELTNPSASEKPQNMRQMIRLIDRHLTDEEDWKMFETNFNQVHEVFFKKLKTEFDDLTPGDMRLAAYLRMNLSSKEIAPLLNISLRGVENKRYRLRRKLGMDGDKNLVDFLMQY